MDTWTPLWSKIVDSSIWDEDDVVCKIFLTMLALKDVDHVVRMSAYQLAKRSRKTEVEVLRALEVLASPDTKRQEPQPFGGRRIRAVEDGWLILNGEKYREMVRKEVIRQRNLRSQRAWRERQRMRAEQIKPVPSTLAERNYEKGVVNGTIDPDTGQPIATPA